MLNPFQMGKEQLLVVSKVAAVANIDSQFVKMG